MEVLDAGDRNALQELLNRYWVWHFDESLVDVARLLLAADLGWECIPRTISPPVGRLISPLGHALDHEDINIQNAALQILDSTIDVPSGEVFIGEVPELIRVDGFRIGRYPVTNAQYRRFVCATSHRAPQGWEKGTYPENQGDHPVTWVNIDDVEAYGKWIGGRLPNFEEWQRAARGNDDRVFPWGDKIDKPRCNTAELGADGTTPVGTFLDGVSPFHCYDMLGNVWEWTNTWYNDDDPKFRVVCGGSWYYNHDHSTCAGFDFFSKEYSEFVLGFRIVYLT